MLIWTDGFTGVSLNLKKSGADLRGWAHAHFDVPFRPPHFARATAQLISCPMHR